MARNVPFQRTIVDAEGNVVPGAKLRVQRAISGTPLAPIYDGPTGVQINNPADPPIGHETDGFVQVYTPSGYFNFTALSADGEDLGITWEDVPMGDAQAHDAEDLQSGINLNLVGPWESDVTYAIGEDVNHDALLFRSRVADNLNNEPVTDPPTSDDYWTHIPVSVNITGTSATSNSVGTGEKTFETQAGLGYVVGTVLKWTAVSDPSKWMIQEVSGYAGTTLVGNSILANGSGTFDSWTVGIVGYQGADGTDPGLLMTFQDAVTEADPGSGNLQFNDVDISAGNKLMVSDTNRAGDDVSAHFNGVSSWGIAGSRALGILTKSGSTDQAIIDITVVSNETGYTEYTYAFRGGVTAFTDEDAISLQLVPYGSAGNDGIFSGTQTEFTDAANDITAAMSGRTLIANRASAIAFNFDDAATLGSTWSAIIKNENAGTLTLEPDGAETIDGEANMTLAEGQSLVVHCDGTNLRTVLAATGDVTGPSSVTDEKVAVFDSTTGKLLKAGTLTVAEILTYSDDAVAAIIDGYEKHFEGSLAATISTTSGSFGDVTGLVCPVLNGETWIFRIWHEWVTGASTVIELAVNGPTFSGSLVTSATSHRTGPFFSTGTGSAYDTNILNTGSGALSGTNRFNAAATFSADGNFAARWRRSSGAASAQLIVGTFMEGFKKS